MTCFLAWERGGGSQHTNRPKTKASLPSLSTHPPASCVRKKILPGAGGFFLTRGKREFEAPAQGEATARREAGAVRQEVMLLPAVAYERSAQ